MDLNPPKCLNFYNLSYLKDGTNQKLKSYGDIKQLVGKFLEYVRETGY